MTSFNSTVAFQSLSFFNIMKFGNWTQVPSDKNSSNSQEAMPSWPADSHSQPSVAEPRMTVSSSLDQKNSNVLNSDVEVNGSLSFTDDLLIDGRVKGDITSEGVLTVGENANIEAEIKTKSVIILGDVKGNITVTDHVELKSTAKLVGDIQAATLAIESGATFIGRSTVGGAVAGMPAVSSSPKAASVTPKAASTGSTPVNQRELDIDAE